MVRAEGIVISGGIVRARQKYDYFKRLRMNTKPSHGPFHYAAPARMLWRTVRGMVPHKTKRGAAAFERFKAYEGIPSLRQGEARCRARGAQGARLGAGHKYCVLGDLSHQVGWKHKATVEGLEEKRQAAASEYWAKKKEANASSPPPRRRRTRSSVTSRPSSPPPATKGLAVMCNSH